MEKTNKYYGIIENLVRNHKKFAGLEEILDEIIDDVYSHSEVIINSISNDSVINAYLEKVVSTSIITVPKRLKFSANIPAKPAFEIKDLQRANTKLVDKMINGTVEEEKAPVVEEASFVEEDFTEDIKNDELLEALELEVSEQNEEPVEEVVEEEICEPIVLQEEIVEAPIEEAIEEPMEELVIDFEENVEEEQKQEEPLIEEESLLEEAQEVILQEEEEPLLEEAQEIILQEEENEPFELVEEVEEIEATEELVNNDELSPVLDTEENIIDSGDNDLMEIETLEELPSEDTLLSADIEEEETLDLEDLSLQDDVSEITGLKEFEALEEVEEVTPIEEPRQETVGTIDYSVFEFTPENNADEFYAEEIAENIKQINSKRPELNITTIFNLKYKENRSVEEISEELGMSKESVLEALSEIIATV